MKVVFITPVTPYKENMRGPSGLPYHLMVKRPKGVDITIYSYNQNHLSPETIAQVEREIDAEIRLIEQPRWIRWILRLHLTFIRLFLKYPIQYYVRLKENTLEEIKSLHPDLVWIYCQEFSGLSRQLEGYRRLHTLPDCYSLHFYRPPQYCYGPEGVSPCLAHVSEALSDGISLSNRQKSNLPPCR